jgi:hypothetical protein
MDLVSVIPELDGWVPARLYEKDSQVFVDWCYLGRQRFTDPFFSQTIQSCIHRPFNLLFRHQTHIDVLRKWIRMRPGLVPDGFVFHMSRCGSTLVSQMLAALPNQIVISEAGPIDSIIRRCSDCPGITEAERLEWLRWMMAALGQPRNGSENKLFVKLDSWNILNFEFVRSAFPDVPWIFLYRDPVEVLASQMNQRGAHTIPALFSPKCFGLDQKTVEQSTVEEYCARVLAALCRAGLKAYRKGGGLLINYKQLPEVMFTSLLPFFDLSCSASDLERMREVTRFDAKNPALMFTAESAIKKRQTTDAVRKAAEVWLQPAYDELENERLNASIARAG